jgi:glucose-6-phosphate 1-dehydrogenase
MTAAQAENPLREGLRLERTPEPNATVIFGATGDLTHRKLVPALYSLAHDRLLPTGFSVIGFARRDWSDETFRNRMREAVGKVSRTDGELAAVWKSFAEGLHYVSSDFSNPKGYSALADLLDRLDRERGTCGNRLFYLAVPPGTYAEIVRQLGASGLARRGASESGWTRIIIEKPFGRDLETARELNRQVEDVFEEGQVYRIDHYLGKETVQNILVFRFSNGIFEPLWNRRYVDHVQITVSEDLGMEDRGSYYDGTGATRDIVQNHMLQLLALIAMEPPASFAADSVRDEKVKLLHSIRPFSEHDVAEHSVRGQYGAGSLAGEDAPAYRDEPEVSKDSDTETYVALKLFVENWRWAGVPFYLRTGKRLPKRVTEISVHFRRAPHLLFPESGAEGLEPNVLALRIQPNEGISLRFGAKMPGPTMDIRSVNMDFRYGTAFGVTPPDAYHRLLLDAMLGDSTLFTRRDGIEAAWSLVTPLLESWAAGPRPQFPNYEAGTWGPDEAQAFIERDGRRWRRL